MARAALGADGALGWSVWGHSLEVEADARHGRDSSTVLIKATPAGPWSWLTYGTKSHPIRRRKPGKHPQALRMGGGDAWITGPVIHPGTTGRGTWDGLVKRLTDEAVDRAVEALLRAEAA